MYWLLLNTYSENFGFGLGGFIISRTFNNRMKGLADFGWTPHSQSCGLDLSVRAGNLAGSLHLNLRLRVQLPSCSVSLELLLNKTVVAVSRICEPFSELRSTCHLIPVAEAFRMPPFASHFASQP